jgi:predicted transcriptional regulator
MQQTQIIVSAQVPTRTREQLLRLASRADRSLSAEIRRALAEHLAREGEKVYESNLGQ